MAIHLQPAQHLLVAGGILRGKELAKRGFFRRSLHLPQLTEGAVLETLDKRQVGQTQRTGGGGLNKD